MSMDLNEHLTHSIFLRSDDEDTLLPQVVDVLLKSGSCFAVVLDHREIRTTERGAGFLQRAGLM